jgi:hypothetical protein
MTIAEKASMRKKRRLTWLGVGLHFGVRCDLAEDAARKEADAA